jgi:hypothetical protein
MLVSFFLYTQDSFLFSLLLSLSLIAPQVGRAPHQQQLVMQSLSLEHTFSLLCGQDIEALLEGEALLGELVVRGEAGCVGVR